MITNKIDLIHDLGITTNSVELREVKFRTDDSNIWDISVEIKLSTPERQTDETIDLSEHHMMDGRIAVSSFEIGAVAGVEESEVKNLSLDVTQQCITAIVVNKLKAALGINES